MDIVVRAAVIFVFLYVLMRVIGRRELVQDDTIRPDRPVEPGDVQAFVQGAGGKPFLVLRTSEPLFGAGA